MEVEGGGRRRLYRVKGVAVLRWGVAVAFIHSPHKMFDVFNSSPRFAITNGHCVPRFVSPFQSL